MASSQLTEDDVRYIFGQVQAGETQAALAIDFDVSQQTISEIATGASWSWLTGKVYVKKPHAKISTDQVLQIDAALRAGLPVKEITTRFGLSAGTVSQIKNGKRWAGVTGRVNRRPRH